MTDKAWAQFLFVTVPVLALIGSWLALRATTRPGRQRGGGTQDENEQDKAKNR